MVLEHFLLVLPFVGDQKSERLAFFRDQQRVSPRRSEGSRVEEDLDAWEGKSSVQ